jgi:hypothetical protein
LGATAQKAFESVFADEEWVGAALCTRIGWGLGLAGGADHGLVPRLGRRLGHVEGDGLGMAFFHGKCGDNLFDLLIRVRASIEMLYDGVDESFGISLIIGGENIAEYPTGHCADGPGEQDAQHENSGDKLL